MKKTADESRRKMVWQHMLRRAGRLLLDFVFPPRCPLCDRLLGRRDHLVCSDCAGSLPWIREPVCKKCGGQLMRDTQEYCADCLRMEHRYIRGDCIFRYEKEMRDSVTRMKFQNRRDYLEFYARAMAVGGKRFLMSVRPAVLLPVPIHKRKRRERGFDQCALLAEKFSAVSGIPVSAGNMIRTRYTRPQKELDREGRKKNLQNAFRLQHPGQIREPVLIIDDIYTTGSTIDAVTEELNRYGIREVFFMALCTGARRE